MTPRRALSYTLAVFAFAATLSIAGMNAALALVSLAVLWSLFDPRMSARSRTALRDAVRSPAFLALAAYALWEPISGLGGLDPAASLRLWPKELHKLWVFLALWTALTSAEDAPIAQALACGMSFHALVGIGQGLVTWSKVDNAARILHQTLGVRAHGFLHPVTYGEILGFGLITAAAFLERPGRMLASPERSRATRVAAVLFGAALLLNGTRAILAALAAAYAAAALTEPRWRRRALAATCTIVAVLSFWEVMPNGGRSIRALFSISPKNSSQRSRIDLWSVAVKAGREHPLFGVGSGQYYRAFSAYHPQPMDGQDVWSNAHNLFLHQFAERGLPGLAVLLVSLWLLASAAWRAARERADGWALAAWSGTAAFIVMNLTETAFQTEQVATLFLFLWIRGAGPKPGPEIL